MLLFHKIMYLIILTILLTILFSCNTPDSTETATELKNYGSRLSEVANSSKGHSRAILGISENVQVKTHAEAIIVDQDKVIEIAGAVKNTGSTVAAKDKEIRELKSKKDKYFNIAMTGLSVVLILCAVLCFTQSNIKMGLSCFAGVIGCLAMTWFFHHIGLVIAAVIICALIYFFIKNKNKLFKEMYESGQELKSFIPENQIENAKLRLINIQSNDTKKHVAKHKSKGKQ